MQERIVNTYVTLRGTTSEPIRRITEIRIRDIGGTATGMIGLLLCHIIINNSVRLQCLYQI